MGLADVDLRRVAMFLQIEGMRMDTPIDDVMHALSTFFESDFELLKQSFGKTA